MSPDLKRKYELAIEEGKYKVTSEVRDIGDRKVGKPKTIVGHSGLMMYFVTEEVACPEITLVFETSVPASAVKVASATTVYETSVPADAVKVASATTVYETSVPADAVKVASATTVYETSVT